MHVEKLSFTHGTKFEFYHHVISKEVYITVMTRHRVLFWSSEIEFQFFKKIHRILPRFTWQWFSCVSWKGTKRGRSREGGHRNPPPLLMLLKRNRRDQVIFSQWLSHLLVALPCWGWERQLGIRKVDIFICLFIIIAAFIHFKITNSQF